MQTPEKAGPVVPTDVCAEAQCSETRSHQLDDCAPMTATGMTKPLDDACVFAELSSAQRRLWFLSQYAPGNTFYNEPLLALRIEGPIDQRALQLAIDNLVERQEALRTTFPVVDGHPMQRVLPPAPCPIHFADFSGPSHFAVLRRAFSFARAESHRTFDLQAGPLFVTSLARLGDTDHLLTAAMHHIITDGWSLRVLLSELVSLYAYHAGLSVVLPDPPKIGYLDYGRWEKNALDALRLTALLGRWRQRLNGASPYFDFLIDFKRPDVPSYRGGLVKRVLPADAVNKLRRFAHRQGASLYVVLLTLFKCLIARLSGRFDILVGTPVANRHLPEAERLIGLFVNVIVVRTLLSGNPTFPVAVQRVAESFVDALENQMMPFDLMVSELCPKRDRHRQPFIQLFFAHHNFPHRYSQFQQLRITRWDIAQDECKFDLVLFTSERDDDALDVQISYSRDVYRSETAVRLSSAYMAGLQRIADDDAPRLSVLFKPSILTSGLRN